MTALSTLVKPSVEGTWAVPHLLLFATLHPTSAVRTSWDTYILALLFSVCIITPVRSLALVQGQCVQQTAGTNMVSCLNGYAVHDLFRRYGSFTIRCRYALIHPSR